MEVLSQAAKTRPGLQRSVLSLRHKMRNLSFRRVGYTPEVGSDAGKECWVGHVATFAQEAYYRKGLLAAKGIAIPVPRTLPGDTPNMRLNARQNAASDW